MKLSKRYLNILYKYKDIQYLDTAPKYILDYDLKSIGINVKPCYDIEVLRGIIRVLVERV